MKLLIFIFLGGGVGAVSRYLLSSVIQQNSNTFFPMGTLAVNLTGCFLIGFFSHYFTQKTISPEFRLCILTGMFGAFTTFSTFSLETVNLLKDGKIMLSLLNILANNIPGLLFVILGITASKFITRLIL